MRNFGALAGAAVAAFLMSGAGASAASLQGEGGQCLKGAAGAVSLGACAPANDDWFWLDIGQLEAGPLMTGDGACLGVKGEGLILDECRGGPSQKWAWDKAAGAVKNQSHCLTLKGGAPVLAACDGSAGQRWSLMGE